MSFNEEELAFIGSQPLARVATVSTDGQPDVVPVALEYDGTNFWFGGGPSFITTRKARNILDGNYKTSVVLDQWISLTPFIARGIKIYGHAEGPFDRDGMVGPGTYIRLTPTVSWSWNMAGEPVGETWYEMRRSVHS